MDNPEHDISNAADATAATIDVTDTNFESNVINASLPVIVDFWATWCGPCKQIAPIVDELAIEYAGKVIFAKVNIEEAPEVTSKFGIQGVPTLIFFKNGEVVERKMGAISKSEIKAIIE